MAYPEAVEKLAAFLRYLPGIGRRGAERMALSMVMDWDDGRKREFGELCSSLPVLVGVCPGCGNLSDGGRLCRVCSDVRRDESLLCVVETSSQLEAIERGGAYCGRYIVLGGRLSPLDGEDGSHLRFDLLKERSSDPAVKEVILAMSGDVEGRATAHFAAELLRSLPLKITRLGLGLPAGANISGADGATLTAAFSGRSEMNK